MGTPNMNGSELTGARPVHWWAVVDGDIKRNPTFVTGGNWYDQEWVIQEAMKRWPGASTYEAVPTP